MRAPNPDLERSIREAGLTLLMEKEPEQITMRDIARECGVSATAIYYYYADKDALLERIKLDCLASMADYIADRVQTGTREEGVDGLREGLTAFRDWSFENPRIAILVMGRFKANADASPEELARYYQASGYAQKLVEKAVASGRAESIDPRLDSSLAIAAVWGAVESILMKRTWPEYWEKGIEFTDSMIDMIAGSMARKRPLHDTEKETGE